jgi:hypothetical protein
MDFSHMEAERLEIEHVDFSLRHSVRGATTALANRCRGVDLQSEVDPDVPDRFVGDPERLRQVLMKLAQTAVKCCSAGRIRIHVQSDPEETRTENPLRPGLSLIFSVQDDGEGIPKEKRDVILDPFGHWDGSASRTYGGAALGLAVCGCLVRLMGGRIWMDHELECGNRFYFTARLEIPARATIATAQVTPAAHRDSKDRLRILVVEDNRINQVVTLRMLEKRGFQTLLAANGVEALQALQAESVDLVLMDVHMPEMDGFETIGSGHREHTFRSWR